MSVTESKDPTENPSEEKKLEDVDTDPICSDKKLTNDNSTYKFCQMTVKGHKRWFSLVIPKSLSAVSSWPGLLYFHGGGVDFVFNEAGDLEGGPAEDMVRAWPSLAGKYAFLIVVPYGEVDANNKGDWSWQKGRDRNDYTFIENLVTWLEKEYPLDSKRIFGGGHSSGGIFLFSWATGGPFNEPVYKTDKSLFRAISTSGANLNLDNIKLPSQLSTSLFHLHGEYDSTQYWQASEDLLDEQKKEDSKTYVTEKTIENVLTKVYCDPNGCWYPVFSESTPSTFGSWSKALDCSPRHFNTRNTSCAKAYMNSYCGNGKAIAELRRIKNCEHPVGGEGLRVEFFSRFCSDDRKMPCPEGFFCDAKNSCVKNPHPLTSCDQVCKKFKEA